MDGKELTRLQSQESWIPKHKESFQGTESTSGQGASCTLGVDFLIPPFQGSGYKHLSASTILPLLKWFVEFSWCFPSAFSGPHFCGGQRTDSSHLLPESGVKERRPHFCPTHETLPACTRVSPSLIAEIKMTPWEI